MKKAWEYVKGLPLWLVLPAVAVALGGLWQLLKPKPKAVGVALKPLQSASEVEGELKEATDAIEDSRNDALDNNPFR